MEATTGSGQEIPLRRLLVDLSEIELIADQRDEYLDDANAQNGYVDTQTGAVHIIFRDVFRWLEGDIEEEELLEWQKGDLEEAAAIWEDTSGRYEEIERWESQEEYELMEEFTERSQNRQLRAELFQALNGRKPFRNFKEVLSGWPKAREAWFSYQAHAHKEWVRRWLNGLGIDPIDTSSYQPDPLPETW